MFGMEYPPVALLYWGKIGTPCPVASFLAQKVAGSFVKFVMGAPL
jgi:hypothetical protein